MPDRLDKAVERRHARMLDCQRTWKELQDSGNEWISIESKERERLPLWLVDAVLQALRNAPAGKLPLVVLHQKGTPYRGDLVVLQLGDFIDWFGREE